MKALLAFRLQILAVGRSACRAHELPSRTCRLPRVSIPPPAWLQQPSACEVNKTARLAHCMMSRPLERAFRAALPPSPGVVLRVVSYNLLANKYALTQNHDYCPLEFRRWSYRLPRLLEELLGFQGDIVCLQEVEEGVFEEDIGRQMHKEGFEVNTRRFAIAICPESVECSDLKISPCARAGTIHALPSYQVPRRDLPSLCALQLLRFMPTRFAGKHQSHHSPLADGL